MKSHLISKLKTHKDVLTIGWIGLSMIIYMFCWSSGYLDGYMEMITPSITNKIDHHTNNYIEYDDKSGIIFALFFQMLYIFAIFAPLVLASALLRPFYVKLFKSKLFIK